MNSAGRRRLRTALQSLGFDRVEYTYDPGDGMYTETWQTPGELGDTVQVSWGPRT